MNSFKGVHAFQIELEFGIVGFEERGKPANLVKNLLEQAREPTTNSTHIWLRCRDLTQHHIGGRRVLSPLHHQGSKLKKMSGRKFATSYENLVATLKMLVAKLIEAI